MIQFTAPVFIQLEPKVYQGKKVEESLFVNANNILNIEKYNDEESYITYKTSKRQASGE